MTDLLIVTLGPVQDFIAAARRTRDLWFGSHLLSEVSRAAARALIKGGAELVFPAIDGDSPELEACLGPLRSNSEAPLAIANKIVAVVSNGEKAARQARSGANEQWRVFAARVRTTCKGLLAQDIDDVWDEQIDTFLEFHAAWLPLTDDSKYDEVRRELEGAISARKQLRDFAAWKHSRRGAPKSSLDGARESVLAAPKDRAPYLVRRYRIEDGEQLDAIGLVKRAGGEPEQFVPIANIALAGWIERARAVADKRLTALEKACEEVGIGTIDRHDLRWTRAFSHDAMVFFPNRWEPVLKEAQYSGNTREWGTQHVKSKLFDKSGAGLSPPSPYVACIVADGDRVGNALASLSTRNKQRKFAAALSDFAVRAREIVEQRHRGALVYGGGDDVLAFVCLDDALACADALRRAFSDIVDLALRAAGDADTERPTLSVGIGVGHVMESMGHLLELGRRAEKRAKDPEQDEGEPRNALAILLDKRSGGEVIWRNRWDHAGQGPVDRLAADRALLRQRLSMKKVHEVHSFARRLPSPDVLIEQELRDFARLLEDDVTRALARTHDGEGIHPVEAGLELDVRAGYATMRRRVEHWVARMLCARMFNQVAEGGGRNG